MRSKYISDYVYLAEASYADFTNPEGIPFATSSDDYTDALKNSNFALKETDGQIVTHRDNWDVVTNWKDRVGDDWSIDALKYKESSFSFINNRRKIWVQ